MNKMFKLGVRAVARSVPPSGIPGASVGAAQSAIPGEGSYYPPDATALTPDPSAPRVTWFEDEVQPLSGVGGVSFFAVVYVSDTAPVDPADGMMWWDSVGTQLYVRYNDGNSSEWVIANNTGGGGASDFTDLTGTATYAQLPAEVVQVPVSFVFSGKPATGASVNVPMAMSLAVPPTLAGTVVFQGTVTTGDAAFIVRKISPAGAGTLLGTVLVTNAGLTSCILTGPGGLLAAGDTLQVQAPSVQDATLTDVSLSILLNRV